MGTYIVLIIMTVIIAAFVKKQENGAGVCILTRQQACNYVCLLAIFLLLFGISACRYQVGNDYSRYEEFFHLIPLGEVVPTEFGFNAVVLAMQMFYVILSLTGNVLMDIAYTLVDPRVKLEN